MFTGGDPIIVSEDSVTFAHVMFIFNEYEKYVSALYVTYYKLCDSPACYSSVFQAKPGSSHTDVNEALKQINCHLVRTFPRDFPFHLVLASNMYKWEDHRINV